MKKKEAAETNGTAENRLSAAVTPDTAGAVILREEKDEAPRPLNRHERVAGRARAISNTLHTAVLLINDADGTNPAMRELHARLRELRGFAETVAGEMQCAALEAQRQFSDD